MGTPDREFRMLNRELRDDGTLVCIIGLDGQFFEMEGKRAVGEQKRLADILSVVTGKALSFDAGAGFKRVLSHMTGTHWDRYYGMSTRDGLPNWAEEQRLVCRESILRQYPQLAIITLPDKLPEPEKVNRWLAHLELRYGNYLTILPLSLVPATLEIV